MSVLPINPKNKSPLSLSDGKLVDREGNIFPIIRGVVHIAESDNYTRNFGLQWNKFDRTQLDSEANGLSLSRDRFFAESGWLPDDLDGNEVLEVGSGAGRFSKVVLEHTKAQLFSVDYSDAVTANFKNNGAIAPDRFHLFQASIYEMPFPDDSFDKVFCFGVLQHTPDFQSSVKALISKAKPGGEIVVDFYPIKGFWTKVHAKYIFRPWTKKLNHERLFHLIDRNVDWLIILSKLFNGIGLGVLTRFLPLVDLRTMPNGVLSQEQFREWVVLDTFDMFSPEHDHPQKISDVAEMFTRYDVNVTYKGYVEYAAGFKAAVVRGVKMT
jgi:SAM-dependent methyltransferase